MTAGWAGSRRRWRRCGWLAAGWTGRGGSPARAAGWICPLTRSSGGGTGLGGRRGVGVPPGVGRVGVGHPLLGAAVDLPGTGGVVLTGRLSLATHPWLADHQVAGTVLLPGAAFAELVVRAGDEAGCGLVEELVLQAPLVLPARGGVQVRVSVSGPSDDGRRTAEVHSRGDDAGAGEPWTLHAAGTLTAGPAPVPSFDLAAWPPPGAEPADVAGLYDVLAGRGLAYGPAFP